MGNDDRSWRDKDRGRDRSDHRREEHRGPGKGRPARVESATAAYKRSLNAYFDRGVVPDSIKDKLGPGSTEGSPRQKALRAIRDAGSQRALEKAVDDLFNEFGLPDDDMDILLRVLEHSKDPVLKAALDKVEAFVESGLPVPRKARFISRLKGIEVSSFDPFVQGQAGRLARAIR
jgi:hypothetical protein